MPWVRFDDRFPSHRKVRRLSDAAFRLHVSAIHWCSEHLTDGRIPDAELELVSDSRSPRRAVVELVRAGLWHAVDDGWTIHDFLEYQPSASKVKAEREAKRERQERWREGKKASQRLAGDASQPASRDASQDAAPYPTRPVPVPSPSRDLGRGVAETPGAAASPPPGSRARCQRHAHLPDDDPGPNCVACRDVRLAAEKKTTAPAAKPDWCGECDENTRQVEREDGSVGRCRDCHPLRSVS